MKKERMDQRADLLQEAENYKKALLWAEFESVRREGTDAQEKHKKIEADLQAAQTTIDPLAEQVAALDTKVKKLAQRAQSLPIVRRSKSQSTTLQRRT